MMSATMLLQFHRPLVVCEQRPVDFSKRPLWVLSGDLQHGSSEDIIAYCRVTEEMTASRLVKTTRVLQSLNRPEVHNRRSQDRRSAES